ncbi:MAG TPA: hypothetical protein VGS78_11660 [Candidatus Sulfotelmatobacter sp.]|nr:hypothetical protein [Candidatus Sulfotelmatobacter sp.]
MDVSAQDKHQPKCWLSHHFINKLSVIIGSCQLLQEQAEESDRLDAEGIHRLAVIMDIAKEMSKELREHECQLDAATKMLLVRDPSTTLAAEKH